ncbi:DUF2281 domain-containing protein [Myxosarcina sp. GI1]|uniref:DUF2281 domain-containing protein n=1 Tax=Myxosarcina sp. GI1 TaxID=1541065 RepID=UPI00055BDCEB|nr:DUF2281 domain-containing protein [Myxosarcina sp. GI1]
MNKAKYNSEEILSSIQSLPEESLGELVNFIEYLQYKNSSKANQDNQIFSLAGDNLKTKITSEESEQIIEEILIEVGDSIPSLDDYAVSRAGIYSN